MTAEMTGIPQILLFSGCYDFEILFFFKFILKKELIIVHFKLSTVASSSGQRVIGTKKTGSLLYTSIRVLLLETFPHFSFSLAFLSIHTGFTRIP